MDFSKFDQTVDLEGLKADIDAAKENSGNFKEVPHGDYEVRVEKMELVESKKGDPMVSVWFKILAGDYKNSMIFYNQVITRGFQIHLVNQLLRSMESGIQVDFISYSQYAQLLLDVHEAIDGKLEYGLRYSENKGFNTFEITDVFEIE